MHPLTCVNKSILFSVCLALASLSSATLFAQNNFSATFRPSANLPVSHLGEAQLTNGGGFEVTASWQFMNHLAAYAGWGYNSFTEKETSMDSKLHFKENGYTFGLLFLFPLCKESKLNLVFGAGGVYNHIETENAEGDLLSDTEHEMGWQFEGGLSIPLGERWKMIPNVRYRSITFDSPTEGASSPADLNYISVGAGVSWILWSKK